MPPGVGAVRDPLLRARDAPAVALRLGARPLRRPASEPASAPSARTSRALAARERGTNAPAAPRCRRTGSGASTRSCAPPRLRRRRRPPRQLLEHEDVREEVRAGAAYSSAQGGPEPELGELAVELAREPVRRGPTRPRAAISASANSGASAWISRWSSVSEKSTTGIDPGGVAVRAVALASSPSRSPAAAAASPPQRGVVRAWASPCASATREAAARAVRAPAPRSSTASAASCSRRRPRRSATPGARRAPAQSSGSTTRAEPRSRPSSTSARDDALRGRRPRAGALPGRGRADHLLHRLPQRRDGESASFRIPTTSSPPRYRPDSSPSRALRQFEGASRPDAFAEAAPRHPRDSRDRDEPRARTRLGSRWASPPP